MEQGPLQDPGTPPTLAGPTGLEGIPAAGAGQQRPPAPRAASPASPCPFPPPPRLMPGSALDTGRSTHTCLWVLRLKAQRPSAP